MSKYINETLGLDTEKTKLLDERLEAHRNNPNEGASFKVVKARIKEFLLTGRKF